MAIDRDKILAAAQKYVEKKKYDRAVAEYQKVIQEDPNDARTLLKIGDLQSKMEAFGDAVGTYERVGKFYASQGFALKAIAVYKQIREIIAKHVPQLEDQYGHIAPKLAELYQQLGLVSDALAALDSVATRLQRQNRDADAIDVFRKIVDLDPSNPLPHLRLAEALSRAKDVDSAVGEFGTASRQLVKLGRRDDALKVMERLLQHKPDPVHARTAAELYLQRDQPNDGLQALSKLQICFQASPRDLDTLSLLAKAFNQIGQASKALEVNKEMARIARDTGKTDLFRELLAKLQKLAPNDEGVKQLVAGSLAPPGASSLPPGAAMSEPPAASPPPPQRGREPSLPTLSRDESSYQNVGDSDIEPEELAPPVRMPQRSLPEVMVESSVVEGSLDDFEETASGLPPEMGDDVQRTLADAEAQRRAHRYERAIDILRRGMQVAPRSIQLHEALRDCLLESGRMEGAVEVMLATASIMIDQLDGENAARVLQNVLELQPECSQAVEMLQHLGYELVEDPRTSDMMQSLPGASAPQLPYEVATSYDPEAPLPSYDLEEMGPEHVAPRAYSEPSIRTATAVAMPIPTAKSSLNDVDDPFGDAPLPSFPLDPPATESAEAMALDDLEPNPTSARPAPAPELESALEEAEFFTSRGLYDDARMILEEQAARLPNHPLIIERLAEIDAQERGTVGGSGTRPSPSAAAGLLDRSFDIAATLGALEEHDAPSNVGGAFGDDVNVDEVFAKFKEGVAAQIGLDDAQGHYDIGVAYKEMMLLDDAIREFEVAAQDTKRSCACFSMIGTIQLERGNLSEAIEAFSRGLKVPERTTEQEAVLCYEIGAVYEARNMSKPALDYFQRAARLIPSFRDVQDRIRTLSRAAAG